MGAAARGPLQRRAMNHRPMNKQTQRLVSLIILIWLLVGVVAAAQRDYFDSGPVNCAGFGTIAVTVLAGPLNYMGANPRIADCNLPQPSP